MVRFPAGRRLGHELATDPLTEAYHLGPDDEYGAALVALPDRGMLDGLAASAHREGGACGAVEGLDLFPLAQASALTPPLFDPTQKLPAVDALLAKTDKAKIVASVKALEALGTRHHASATGLKASDDVEAMFEAAISGKIAGATIEQVSHADTASKTQQKSVVVKIPGTDQADAAAVVFGAHLDSINSSDPAAAPGADDDASGVASLVEVARVIASSGAAFRRPIELHAYAAEEVGLYGSGQIAQTYASSGRKVAGMFQMDMNSYSSKAGALTIYLVKNDTSGTLRRVAKDLLSAYLGGDFAEKPLSRGTSDHKSWTKAGFAAVFPFEDPQDYNDSIHTAGDTSAKATNHALSERFVKLALAYAAHTAGLVAAEAEATAAEAQAKAALPKDLKLAVKAEGSQYRVSVAAPATVAKVEVCAVGAAGSPGCVEERVDLTKVDAKGERQLHGASVTLPLADGSRLAVFGYDASDKIVARRNVRFQVK